jgi:hypothetical protein
LEHEDITSGVTVVSNGRAAAGDLAAARSAAGLACLRRILRKRFAGERISRILFARVDVSSLPVRVPGEVGSMGFRIVLTLLPEGSEFSVPAYVDILGFISGPAEIGLVTTSIVQPEPTATEEQLLSLLLQRVHAHPL